MVTKINQDYTEGSNAIIQAPPTIECNARV